MLSLLEHLEEIFGPFRLFGYVSTRVVGAAVCSFLCMLVSMGPLIRYLQSRKLAEQGGKGEGADIVDAMREEKAGTPTMGGLGLITCAVFSALLWCRPDVGYTWLLIVTLMLFGFLGFIDDRTKLLKDATGLSKRAKIILQIFFGIGVGFWIYSLDNAYIQVPSLDETGKTVYTLVERAHHLTVPFMAVSEWTMPLGVGLIIWVVVMTFACSNSVNFTDGMDGLASGCVLIAMLAFMIIAYLTSRTDSTAYLDIFFVPGTQEVAVFCASIAGASLGFLWFNAAPAQVFMGDTGSQALGGALAVIATCVKQEFLLFLVGSVFFLEGLSVALQVASYRLRGGKRIFLCAPLHHHFQYKGWPETRIVVRFWIIAALTALLALASLKVR